MTHAHEYRWDAVRSPGVLVEDLSLFQHVGSIVRVELDGPADLVERAMPEGVGDLAGGVTYRALVGEEHRAFHSTCTRRLCSRVITGQNCSGQLDGLKAQDGVGGGSYLYRP